MARTFATTAFFAKLLEISAAMSIGVVVHEMPSFTAPSGIVMEIGS
jgi:hypothetical protein